MIEPALSLFSATRHLERIADHATNIAEDVINLIEAEIVRHRPEAIKEQGEAKKGFPVPQNHPGIRRPPILAFSLCAHWALLLVKIGKDILT